MQVKKQQLEPDMEQETGSKLEKEFVKAVYCHPVYLPSTQTASYEMPGWMNHKLELRFLGEISTTSGRNINNLRYSDDTILCELAKWWSRRMCAHLL